MKKVCSREQVKFCRNTNSGIGSKRNLSILVNQGKNFIYSN